MNDSGEPRRSLVQQAMALLPLPAGLRPEVRELAPLFRFGAVQLGPDEQPRIDHARLVALIDGLAYFNASRRELEVRLAANSKTSSAAPRRWRAPPGRRSGPTSAPSRR